MRFSLLLGLSLSAALGAHATPGPYKGCEHKVKESIYSAPRGWIKGSPAPPNQIIELKIALPQSNFHVLKQHLWEVSDPEHARYGVHLSKEETEALMAPHDTSIDAVNEWLASHGFYEEHLIRSSAKDWVTIRVPVSLAEEMLNTTYHVYHHAKSGDSIIRTTSYSLPEILHEHIELIQPTTMFARFKAMKSTLHWAGTSSFASTPVPGTKSAPHRAGSSALLSSSVSGTVTGPAGNQVDASCNITITLSCLRQIYNAVDYNTSATNGNKIGITAYIGEYANIADLEMFYQNQNPAAYGSNFTFLSVNGGINSQVLGDAGMEANLDTQFAFGLTYPTPGTFYSTNGTPPSQPDAMATSAADNEPYSYWLDYVLSQPTLPQAISTSYGDDEQTVPYTFASRICDGFAALGARGVSVIFSSGDGGVGDGDPDPATQECYTNDGRNATAFVPEFPSTCPYVTSVGGTFSVPEQAVFFSGGGFSNYFLRPDYQEVAVQTYLDKLAPGTYEGLYNPYGRGIPDVAAQSHNFLMVFMGELGYVAGTSCSAPTFAAFVSMLNDARIEAKKPTLGFLNPFLYSKGYTALNDITEGNNPGCGTQGFNATTGWDAVTGLGTPNFEKLKELVLAM
ncbi:peptidase S8/S53 domain-containing protein [Hygrophoropsis aurantiaca]|uniref:Peptidase S8/S53 domain-containing protein n=1 Tax=Hygrophoropsis aurantiaca TaxID=72124 RepID=A0ACB8A9L2_9AGAM|nr:peptidase S8/S53 domain-containing protein [Hygrophoropsis aurantiaca]